MFFFSFFFHVVFPSYTMVQASKKMINSIIKVAVLKLSLCRCSELLVLVQQTRTGLNAS